MAGETFYLLSHELNPADARVQCAVRSPNSPMGSVYVQVEKTLVDEISGSLKDSTRLPGRKNKDKLELRASIVNDFWNGMLISFIRDENTPLHQHQSLLRKNPDAFYLG